MADLFIGFLQDALVSVLHSYDTSKETLPHEDIMTEVLPAPIYEGNTGERATTCIRGDEFRSIGSSSKVC